MSGPDPFDTGVAAPLSLRGMGRLLAALFLMGGLVAALSPLLPPPPSSGLGVVLVGATAVWIALVAWILPWERWPRWAPLPMVVAAFPLIAFYNHFAGAEPFRYVMYFILAFAYLGVAQPRGTSLAFVPLLVVAYLAPLVTAGAATPASLASALLVVPVCVALGESVAWVVEGQRGVQERLHRQLRHDSLSDALTSLANRVLFKDRLDHALALGARAPRPLAVLFIDLDDFKTVNDSLGHAVGDELLTAVAQRLRGCMRSADTVARMGGDEFAILLEDLNDVDGPEIAAERIAEALATPFHLDGRDVVVRASIGIARGTTGTEDAAELLRNADLAMYNAKSEAKGGFRVFEPQMHEATRIRLDLRRDLAGALRRDEFVLHYQPVVDLASGRIAGLEALIRWQRPGVGLVAPGEFLGVAEEIGLQPELGRWVISSALDQLRTWQREVPGCEDLTIGLNLSPGELRQPDLVDHVAATLVDRDIDPSDVTLEILETSLIDHTDATRTTLESLKRLGLSLAIDDFGTGYSSLSYLHRFPIDVLKIDRSFTALLGGKRSDATLAEAIVRLGPSLGLQVVAEGIESVTQLRHLRRLGCTLGQGYLLSAPLSVPIATRLLEDRRRVPIDDAEAVGRSLVGARRQLKSSATRS